MALSYDDLNSTTQAEMDKVLTEQCYDGIPFLKKLKSMDKVIDGGTEVQWSIRYKKLGLANAVEPNSKTTYEKIETRTKAVDQWRFYTVPALMTWEELAKNNGKNKIIDLQADKAKEMGEDLNDRLATDLWTANPNGQGITPISTIVDSATSYAGIAVADCSAWAATEDSSTTTLTIYGGSTSLTGMRNLATFGSLMPNFYLTTKDLLAKYESLLEPKQRYEGKDKSAGLGFTNLFFYGDPVIQDPYVPSGDWYGLCMDVFELVVHPKYNMKFTPWGPAEQAGYPNAAIRNLSWVGNLKCTERRVNFKFTALDASL